MKHRFLKQLLKQKKRPFQALSCRGRDVSKTLVFETALMET